MPMKYKPFFLPLGVVVFILVVGIVGGRYLVGELLRSRAKITNVNSNLDVLEGRLAVLRGLGQTVETFQNDVLYAVPVSNPSLLVSAQIKSIAEAHGLEVNDLKSNVSSLESNRDGLSELTVRFTLAGGREEISQFVEDVTNSTPITQFRGMEMSVINDNIVVGVELVTFWAPLPSELPSIDEPIENLTPEELSLLQQISSFTKPVITELPEAQNPRERVDPFTL